MAIVEYTSEELTNETWKPIPGWETTYQISDLGRTRNLRRPAHILTTRIYNTGYLMVRLWRNNKERDLTIHRLVAAAFLGPCPMGLQVNHRDLNKLNPRLSNLEYVTALENIRHWIRYGLGRPSRKGFPVKQGPRKPRMPQNYARGVSIKQSKLNDEAVRSIRRLLATKQATQKDLAARYGVHNMQISRVKNYKTWKHVS